MNRTIEAIMRHTVPPSARSGSTNIPAQPTGAEVRRKPKRKLDVVFAPPPLKALTTPNH
ncbi:MAG TPA: hypothetical protein VGI41_02510 [Candidatus Udaeobacter sp.]|jgi:hypothetical protein